MSNINSKDYHDFVIKNGQLIGEFEQMYQKSSEIPWHQDQQRYWLDVRLTLELLNEYGPFDVITDFGCGLGYFLSILSSLGTKDCKLIGYDVSATCCERAKILFPQFTFNTCDLMVCNNDIEKYKPTHYEENMLFSIRGVLWYVFPEIENVISNLSRLTSSNNYLLVSQNFPPLHSEFVGKKTIPNPEVLVNLFSENFIPLKTIFLEQKQSSDNSNWFIGFFKRK